MGVQRVSTGAQRSNGRTVDRRPPSPGRRSGSCSSSGRPGTPPSPVPPATARPPVEIDFQPTEASPADNTVTLVKGTGQTDAAHYFIDGVKDVTEIAAHEFGHHVGLPDEYQQSAADRLRQTGEAAPVGRSRATATRSTSPANSTRPCTAHPVPTAATRRFVWYKATLSSRARSPSRWPGATSCSSESTW